MGNNFISLKSRFQNAKGASTRAGDAPKADMEMHPKTASNHAQPATRVEKLTVNSRKRRSQNEVTLTDRFKSKSPEYASSTLPHTLLIDTIQTYRTELDRETGRLLTQTESDLDKQLAHITEEFGGQLKLVAEYENHIFKSISEDRLEIIGGSPEKNGRAQKQHVTLADRMRDFEQVVSEEAARIETLWKEWHVTNLQLACLAVEVLGPDGVELAFNQENKSLAAQMTAAVDANRRHEARRADYKEQAAELESSIRLTARETISNLHEQEKVRWLWIAGMARKADLLFSI